MATITIRLSDKEKEWLLYMAEFYDLSLSDLVKKYSMEELENEFDRQSAEIAKRYNEEHGNQTYSMDEILAEFGGFK